MILSDFEGLAVGTILTDGKNKFSYVGMNRTKFAVAVSTLEEDAIQAWNIADVSSWTLYVDELAVARKQKEDAELLKATIEAEKAALEAENALIKAEIEDLQVVEAMIETVVEENAILEAENVALKAENEALKTKPVDAPKEV